MAPDAEVCETARLSGEECNGSAHPGWRVIPERRLPTQAWTENEHRPGEASPGESRRLLPALPQKHKSKLQCGLTLGVHTKYPEKSFPGQTKQKSKFQKRKEKLIANLKPPYFILSVIILIVCIHLFCPEEVRSWLEWRPGAWWREPWRLLTYGCLHATAGHLALNALVALAVGWRLELEQGWWRVVCVWCGGVVAGALGAGVLQPRVHVVGASAAVYALLLAHLPNVCLRFGHIPLWWFRPLSVVVLGASEGCWALVRAPPPAQGAPLAAAHGRTDYEHIAWSAHALGAAVAVPLAFIVFTGEHDGKRYILVLRIISGAMLVAGVLAATLHYSYNA